MSTLATAPPPSAEELEGWPVSERPLTVLVADDHPLFRRSISRMLRADPRFRVVAEAPDGVEALELIKLLRPDVALLDHRMPGLTGIEVCRRVREEIADLPTALMLLSAYEDGELVSEAVEAGAAGYVGKSETQATVCEAVAQAGVGGLAFTQTTTEGFNRALRRKRA